MSEPISVDYQLPAWTATHLARLNTVVCADLFELCATIPPGSVDMILCDLPYGTTACSWDEIIPFAPMWAAFKRIIKPRGAIVLTGSQPFTSKLIMSNLAMFRYEWIWEKSNIGGFMNAQYRPLSAHESVMVFCAMRTRSNQFTNDRMNYYPIGVESTYKLEKNKLNHETVYNNSRGNKKGEIHTTTQTGFPTTTLKFQSEAGYHPTQKPIPLFEYLIRTYTQPGDLVFDPCVGSGTTALAARSTGRRFICGDKEQQYVDIANARLAQPYTPPLFSDPQPGESAPVQMPLGEGVHHG